MDEKGWSRSAVFLRKPARCITHLCRLSVIDVDTINNADDGSFDRHVLISDRRSRRLPKSAHDHFAGSRTESIGDDNDVARRLRVEIVSMDNQKPDALEIGRLLRLPNCAYNFA